MQPVVILRNIKKHMNGWLFLSVPAAVMILLPIFILIASVFQTPNENWNHIKQYMLQDYVVQSIWLVLFTGVFTVLIGAALAWLVAAFNFPLRAFFRWALILPLAVPPYIAAYTYSSLMSYTGIVQKTLRAYEITLNQGWFDIMSMKGAVFIFTMFLYPYVYMITLAFLERQSGAYIENARLLGRKPLAIFVKIVLPLSRPAIIGGVTLVVFEALSDYGVVNYFGIQTFTTAIFKTWFGLNDIESATRLAAWFMLGIIGVIVLERLMRRHRRYSATTSKGGELVPKRLRGLTGWSAALLCGVVFSLSFLIPVVQLFVWAGWTYEKVMLSANFWKLTKNSISVALVSTALILMLSVIVANTSRMLGNAIGYALTKVITIGYSIPGAIIAIGVLSLFIKLDGQLAPLYSWLGLGEAPLVLSLSIVMLVVAYVIRFTATGYNAVEAGFEKIGTKYFEASRLLGVGVTKAFFKVDFPLIRGAMISGLILTFVEVVKELPLVLLLRPFNYDTLATKAYQYASDERIYSAAVPSLFIISVSMISIIIFHQLGKRVEQ